MYLCILKNTYIYTYKWLPYLGDTKRSPKKKRRRNFSPHVWFTILWLVFIFFLIYCSIPLRSHIPTESFVNEQSRDRIFVDTDYIFQMTYVVIMCPCTRSLQDPDFYSYLLHVGDHTISLQVTELTDNSKNEKELNIDFIMHKLIRATAESSKRRYAISIWELRNYVFNPSATRHIQCAQRFAQYPTTRHINDVSSDYLWQSCDHLIVLSVNFRTVFFYNSFSCCLVVVWSRESSEFRHTVHIRD